MIRDEANIYIFANAFESKTPQASSGQSHFEQGPVTRTWTSELFKLVKPIFDCHFTEILIDVHLVVCR